MAHRNPRDYQAYRRDHCSDLPIICESCLSPCVQKAKAGVGNESDTITTFQRTTPLYERNRMHERFGMGQPKIVCRFYLKDQCTRGANCPYRHDMPSQNITTYRRGSLKDQEVAALVAKPGPGNLEPPEDKSIKELRLRGLNTTIHSQDISDKLVAYGEIEAIGIRFLDEHGWAFVTYTTREGAEKAMQELSGWLVINGRRLKLAWGYPEVHKPDQDSSNQQGDVARRIIASKL